VYKAAMPAEAARDIIAAGRGTQFDPDVTDAFLAEFAAFVAIAREHQEP
jgi:putative two-component system response regulator